MESEVVGDLGLERVSASGHLGKCGGDWMVGRKAMGRQMSRRVGDSRNEIIGWGGVRGR